MYCNPDLQTPYFFMFSFLERPNTTYNKKGGPIPQSVLQAAGQISWCGTMCWSRFCRSGCRRDRPGPNQRGSRRDAVGQEVCLWFKGGPPDHYYQGVVWPERWSRHRNPWGVTRRSGLLPCDRAATIHFVQKTAKNPPRSKVMRERRKQVGPTYLQF